VVVWPLLVDERGGHMKTFVLVKDGYTATTIGQTMQPPQLDMCGCTASFILVGGNHMSPRPPQ
jgi:hypothetical protein